MTDSFLARSIITTNNSPKATRPPCCMDSLSRTACHRLQQLNPMSFGNRCNRDAEFRLIQCCSSCNKHKTSLPYDQIARTVLATNCFDRYGSEFCKRYLNAPDPWELKQWSCSGYSPYMAFRACRKTCGFCDLNRIDYNLDSAIESCKVIQ